MKKYSKDTQFLIDTVLNTVKSITDTYEPTYNEVLDWADKHGLNTDTPENFKEAKTIMLNTKKERHE